MNEGIRGPKGETGNSGGEMYFAKEMASMTHKMNLVAEFWSWVKDKTVQRRSLATLRTYRSILEEISSYNINGPISARLMRMASDQSRNLAMELRRFHERYPHKKKDGESLKEWAQALTAASFVFDNYPYAPEFAEQLEAMKFAIGLETP